VLARFFYYKYLPGIHHQSILLKRLEYTLQSDNVQPAMKGDKKVKLSVLPTTSIGNKYKIKFSIEKLQYLITSYGKK